MIRAFTKEYKWLSNFTSCEIEFRGTRYASVEHAYMSAKNDDPEWQAICADPSIRAGKIKKLSKEIKLKPNWESQKLEVMETCLRSKYSQEPFRSLLLATGELFIQEGNYWGDTFWGVDLKTGEGENRLGRLLMQIRADLQLEEQRFGRKWWRWVKRLIKRQK